MGLNTDELSSLTTEDEWRKDVNRQFAAMNLRLSNQDVLIDSTNTAVRQIAEDTAAMRAAWNDGVAVKRFFCRMAEAWSFILHKVFLRFALPLIGIWAVVRIANHETLPDWITAGIKLVNAVF